MADMMSAPVNPDHPTFDSLLGALKAVYTGERGMEVLVRYHAALSEEVTASRAAIMALPGPPPELEGLGDDQRRVALSSLDVVRAMLDFLQRYIQDPSRENMAACVDLLLQSQRMVQDVRAWLDGFVEG